MNEEYRDQAERPLSDYDLTELQDYAASILNRYKDATDKEVRSVLRKKWKTITSHYNERVSFEAYRTNI